MQKELGERFGSVVGPLRPLLVAAEPRADAAFRPAAVEDGLPRRAHRPSRSIRIADGRFLPDRYVDRHLPALRLRARARRPVRELHARARSGRSDQAALGGVGLPTDIEIRDSRASVPQAVGVRRPSCAPGSRRTRPTGRRWSRRSRSSGWTRACRTAASRATSSGACRCRTTSRRPASKGKVFYVWFDAPIEYIGATKEWADATPRPTTGERWWYGARRRDVTTSVHGQGQRAVPHRRLPGDDHRLGRAVEAGRPAQGLQLAQLLRRQILDQSSNAACSWTRRSSSCRPTTGAIT